jgi:hypothetical protein
MASAAWRKKQCLRVRILNPRSQALFSEKI